MQRDFERLKAYVISRLEKELSNDLHYHSVNHTLDVLEATERIAASEGVDESEMLLLQTAGLLHDIGFIHGHKEHEKRGCLMAGEIMPRFGFTLEDVETICALIMATKVPQSPRSHLQKILCDSDLDYLGRDDFYLTGNLLFEELSSRGKVASKTEWNRLQIKFLSDHQYFTNTNLRDREAKKLIHLNELKQLSLEC